MCTGAPLPNLDGAEHGADLPAQDSPALASDQVLFPLYGDGAPTASLRVPYGTTPMQLPVGASPATTCSPAAAP
jgi:hypothetical protein